MYSAGDKFLFVLSAKKEMSWVALKKVVDTLYLKGLAQNYDNQTPESLFEHSKYMALRNLDMLGHCSVLFSQSERVVKAVPPIITRLPHAGCSTAVLAGSRTPELIERLVNETKRNDGVELSIVEQQSGLQMAPSAILFRSMEFDEIADIACRVDIRMTAVPSAWSLINISGSVDEYLGTLMWEKNNRLNWPRKEYDFQNLRFTDSEYDQRYTLEEYVSPINRQFVYFFCKDNLKAEVDKDWGRFLVLSHHHCSVMYYDADKFILGVPARLPLPRLYSRALTLCSGKLPVTYDLSSSFMGQEVCGPLILYKSVPDSIARMAAEKLNQSLTSISFH